MEKKTSGVRTVRALDAGQNPPQVDGSLDDRCWQQAEWQGGFVQLKPSMGEPARAHTRVAVAYDSKHIFVAFRCFNPTGPGANSRITRRDDNMDLDNAVTLYLDSFHSRRDCYYFSTNSLGTQVDGRIGDDGRSNDKSWDCTWYTASQQDSLGWTSEMAIPVAEIRFPRDSDTPWGINFRRNYPELYEISLWNESDKTWQVSRFGDLAGLDGLEKKFSAALYPYIVSLDTNTPGSDRRTVYSSGGTEVIAGADLRFNIGAAARGNLTFNPDFATIEADQEVINLTRYETFYPEKRLYFLEGAELFKNRINVFNSRRIGDIDYGLKSNGRIGKYNFAMLSARERASVGLSPASRTSVFRLQRDVLGSSTIGFLAVDRSFSGGYNRVLSTDATLYFPSHVKFTSQFVGSFPSGSGKFTKAYFLRCARETEAYHYHLRYSNYDPGFRENVNAVGFIRNDDRHELDSDIRYEWWIKKHNIEKINFFSKNNVFWSHGGALRNVELTDWVGMTFLRKWLVGFSNSYHTELYEKRYRNHHKLAEMGYNQQHWNSYGLLYIWGRNFDSDYTRWVLRANFKPGDDLSIKYSFTHLRFSPDPNKKSTNLHVLTTDYNFTPDIYLRLFTQYNSRNDRFYLYGLFGWRFAPPFGALYLAYTANRFDEEYGLFDSLIRRERQRTFFLKLTVPLNLRL